MTVRGNLSIKVGLQWRFWPVLSAVAVGRKRTISGEFAQFEQTRRLL